MKKREITNVVFLNLSVWQIYTKILSWIWQINELQKDLYMKMFYAVVLVDLL